MHCLEIGPIEDRATRQRDALLALAAEPLDDCDALPAVLSRILEVAAATLAVRRVGIWRYNDARTAIECLDQFDAQLGEHTAGQLLSGADCPSYFAALAHSEVVAVDDAMNDPRTREFIGDYLVPLGIASMMDVPIHRGRAVAGVVCHEHVGPPRRWTSDEKAFAIAVSNVIALAFERCERHRAEAAVLLQSAALNAAAHPIVITDCDATIAWVNRAFTAFSGFTPEQAVGRSSIELLDAGRHDESFFQAIFDTVRAGNIWRGEVWNRRKDGSMVLLDQTVTPVRDAAGRITHFVAIKVDLTRQRNLEGQFLQAQKMEVVGRLAGGIAHDFNNLLTVIIGTAEMALTDLPDNHPLRTDFERIQQAGARAAGMTRQLLTFSRKQIVNRVPLAIAPVLTGFTGMLQRLIGEDISLEVHVNSGNAAVLADQAQIEQLVLNLVVNARDAMPRGGRLVIEAACVELDPRFGESHRKVSPGPYVRISVADTGEGMPEDVLARMFEPFFTTKESGKGTGLGLATVYAIVEQSGGTIWASSVPNEGSTFTIYLPRINAALPGDAMPKCQAHGDGERILLVEDDQAVRELAYAILHSAGYRVVTAAGAIEALRLLGDRQDPIHLIVTDVVLAGMGGRALVALAEQLVPGIPVLFTSGHTDDLLLAHGVEERRVHFIGKPYTPAALSNKVREVLDDARKVAGRERLCSRSN